MLDFGFSEILLTSAIALVVLGPEKLPKLARQVGNWMGRARVMARQLTEQLDREVSAEEFLKQQTTAAKKSATTAAATVPGAPAAYPTPLAPDSVPAAAQPSATSTVSDAKHPANE
jgi:sec-independent protein translocase protein TatB